MKKIISEKVQSRTKPDKETILMIVAVLILFATMFVHMNWKTWFILFALILAVFTWYSRS